MFPLLRLASCKTSGERLGVVVCPLKEQTRASGQTKKVCTIFKGGIHDNNKYTFPSVEEVIDVTVSRNISKPGKLTREKTTLNRRIFLALFRFTLKVEFLR